MDSKLVHMGIGTKKDRNNDNNNHSSIIRDYYTGIHGVWGCLCQDSRYPWVRTTLVG